MSRPPHHPCSAPHHRVLLAVVVVVVAVVAVGERQHRSQLTVLATGCYLWRQTGPSGGCHIHTAQPAALHRSAPAPTCPGSQAAILLAEPPQPAHPIGRAGQVVATHHPTPGWSYSWLCCQGEVCQLCGAAGLQDCSFSCHQPAVAQLSNSANFHKC